MVMEYKEKAKIYSNIIKDLNENLEGLVGRLKRRYYSTKQNCKSVDL